MTVYSLDKADDEPEMRRVKIILQEYFARQQFTPLQHSRSLLTGQPGDKSVADINISIVGTSVIPLSQSTFRTN